MRMTLTLGLGIMFYLLGKNEPKQDIEPKTEIIPTYSLTRTNLLCMLRNAQSNKKS